MYQGNWPSSPDTFKKSKTFIIHNPNEVRELKQADLVGVIGSKGVVSEVVHGKRAISKAQAKALGKFFNVNPSVFI